MHMPMHMPHQLDRAIASAHARYVRGACVGGARLNDLTGARDLLAAEPVRAQGTTDTTDCVLREWLHSCCKAQARAQELCAGLHLAQQNWIPLTIENRMSELHTLYCNLKSQSQYTVHSTYSPVYRLQGTDRPTPYSARRARRGDSRG